MSIRWVFGGVGGGGSRDRLLQLLSQELADVNRPSCPSVDQVGIPGGGGGGGEGGVSSISSVNRPSCPSVDQVGGRGGVKYLKCKHHRVQVSIRCES